MRANLHNPRGVVGQFALRGGNEGGETMSYYHMSMSNVSRAAGSSSLATASYITGETIHDELFKGMTYSYGNKDRILEHDIVLPMHADPKLNDVEALFNSIEKFETADNARTAKKIVVALPEECDIDTHRKIIKEYIKENITSEGYACCYALHLNNAGTNPHAHILIPNRRIDSTTGTWEKSKRKTVFALDNDGNKIPVIDSATGKQKIGPRNKKIWKRIPVDPNPLDKKEKLKSMRESWAKCCNKYLSAENQITHLSHKERGLIIKPTIHEGYYARKMEQEGKVSRRCEYNREIKKYNAELTTKINSNKNEINNLEHKRNQMKLFVKGLELNEQRIKGNAKLLQSNTPPFARENTMLRLRGSSLVLGGGRERSQNKENENILQMPLSGSGDNQLQRTRERGNTNDTRMHSEADVQLLNVEKKAVPNAPDPAAKARPEPVHQTQPPALTNPISPPKENNHLDKTSTPTPPEKRVRTRTSPGAIKQPTVGDWIKSSTVKLTNARNSMVYKLSSANSSLKQKLYAGIKCCDANLRLLNKAPATIKNKGLGISGASMPSPTPYNQTAEKSLLDIIKWASDATSCNLSKDLGIVGLSGKVIESDTSKALKNSIERDKDMDFDEDFEL